ncbi:hypothetical protein LSM04_009677 [Trypanosoma melophagium]|uniref:uncharacterized protein n=1 Tax=Trypanosoma melophagium TaxID=715481 RepID=UPI00351AAB61|nr:hypothetical protein LSM04_009677 [Trypanosoma melophagium]
MSLNQKTRRISTTLECPKSRPKRGGGRGTTTTSSSSTIKTTPVSPIGVVLATAASSVPLKETLVSTQRDGNAAEDIITLSAMSSTQNSVVETSSYSPTPQKLQVDDITTDIVDGIPVNTTIIQSTMNMNTNNVNADANAIIPSPPGGENDETNGENSTEASRLLEAHRSEQMLRFLEGARTLRKFDADIEARQQFLQKELQRQRKVCEEKTEELTQKQALYERLQKSSLGLTRQVRGLDTENDRIRDRVTQLRSVIEKALSRIPPRHMRRKVDLNSSDKNIIARTGVVVEQNSSLTEIQSKNGKKGLSYPTSARDLLLTEINTCNRNIRQAETQQTELLNELELLAARRKGRAAAYLHCNPLRTASKRSGEFSRRETLIISDNVQVNDLIQYLDRRTSDILMS